MFIKGEGAGVQVIMQTNIAKQRVIFPKGEGILPCCVTRMKMPFSASIPMMPPGHEEWGHQHEVAAQIRSISSYTHSLMILSRVRRRPAPRPTLIQGMCEEVGQQDWVGHVGDDGGVQPQQHLRE